MGFFHFTLLQVALALLSFCVKLAAAQSSAPPPSCSDLFSPNSSWLSQNAYVTSPINGGEDHTRNVTLFTQSSLSLQLTYPEFLSFTFTTSAYSEAPASLAFILVASPSSVRSMELHLTCNNREPKEPQQFSPLHVCNPQQKPKIQALYPQCLCEEIYHDSDETEVSLTYDADTAQLLVQAVDYRQGLKNNQTFTLSTNDLLVSNESTTLFVGYITSGEATIHNVTTKDVTHDDNVTSTKDVTHDDNGKPYHKKVLVWVIVGVCVMGFFMGLIILFLFITKRRGRLFLGSSLPAKQEAPPSAPSRAPFSHHDLESSATPMMRAPPLAPPYTDAFQISGTASWLKQPNPR